MIGRSPSFSFVRLGAFGELNKTEIVLLPGLDGTGRLFKRFIAAAPPHLSLTSIALPQEERNYNDLADHVVRSLQEGRRLVVIAESFSGPLALTVALRRPLAALVFCNSFVVTPRSRHLGWFISRACLDLPVPRPVVRRYMVGHDADDALVDDVVEVVASVPASVLAFRLRLLLDTDESGAFARCDVPTLYLRGTEDRLVPDSASRRMAAVKPMSIVQVPGPHFLLQANPVDAWMAIAPFLKSVLAV